MTHHQIVLGAINLEATDPVALAKFWAAVTGAESSAGGDSVYLPPNGPGGFGMFFQPATVARDERQVAHWDLTVPWGSRAAEVERLIGLDAVHQWDVLDEVPHVQWTTWPIRKGTCSASPSTRQLTSKAPEPPRGFLFRAQSSEGVYTSFTG